MLGIIIQARMGSSRLPGKILKNFVGNTLLGHILARLEKLRKPIKTVIATSTAPADDLTEAFCQAHQVHCFRGSEDNVLERYVQCANEFGFTQVIRMTGDNPFPDIDELRRLIVFHLIQSMEFSENYSVLPIGVGMEIMSFEVLEKSLAGASLPKHFEHVDEYILDNLGLFRHGTLDVSEAKRFPDLRLTVDTPEDYEKACYILRNTDEDYVTTETAIRLCQQYDGGAR